MATERPAPITAAGVLLLVVAGELLLASVAVAVAAIFFRGLDKPVPEGDPLTHLCFASVLAPIAVAWLAMFGSNILRGREQAPQMAVVPFLALGTVGAVSLLALVAFGIYEYLDGGPHLLWWKQHREWIVALTALAVSVTALMLTAGLLLHRHQEKYHAWRREHRRLAK